MNNNGQLGDATHTVDDDGTVLLLLLMMTRLMMTLLMMVIMSLGNHKQIEN
jgi:hypothetical protein